MLERISTENKQHPNKPIKIEIIENELCGDYYMYYVCSKCNVRIMSNMNYCPKCGQKIDW